MQHVIFARDRRRKKNRLKVILFLMAIVSILIGIVLALKNENATLPKTNVPVVFDEQFITEEMSQPAVQQEKPLVDIVGTDGNANILSNHNEELNYIDIEINEDEDHEESESTAEDHSATSYEDELAEKDDVEHTQEPVENSGQQAVETQENSAKSDTAQAETELHQSGETVRPAVLPNSISLAVTPAEEDGTLTPFEPEDFLANSDEPEPNETVEEVTEEQPRKPRHYSYTVTRGDKLRDVLEQSGLGLATTKALERKFPQLANLSVGQQFHWEIDANGELEKMSWLVSEKEEQIFERKDRNRYAVKVIEKQGVWKQDVVKGTISGDFTSSLKNVGLSIQQIRQLASGLQWQIATNKLKKGDKFAILVKREYINGKVTDLGNVEAIHVLSGNRSYYAIQADNGRFYSRQGETLGKGFARFPLQFTPRISSSFNPRRFHPVTKRLAPHKGVDFAVPTGTLIIAPADGVVEHVAYQANGAGRYIKLRHGGQYTTVYMHLSKSLVSVGQSVRKGDRIAFSGNTGRSTGAHLHYEFHINGNPVNPITVKLPGTGSGMPDNERKAFLAKAKGIEAKLKL